MDLRVIVAERPELPLLAAQVVVRSGAEVDPPDLAGTASMTGDFDQGNRDDVGSSNRHARSNR